MYNGCAGGGGGGYGAGGGGGGGVVGGQAGGQGGGGGNGGEAGEIVFKSFSITDITSPIAVTIGEPGVGGKGGLHNGGDTEITDPESGGNGGTTSFGTYITAQGGAGGMAVRASGYVTGGGGGGGAGGFQLGILFSGGDATKPTNSGTNYPIDGDICAGGSGARDGAQGSTKKYGLGGPYGGGSSSQNYVNDKGEDGKNFLGEPGKGIIFLFW